jgi:PAS domain S-box-containing protein
VGAIPSQAVDVAGPTLDRDTLAADAFTSWDAHVAVLDGSGRILLVNAAWERFALDNGGHDVGVGADYLAVCAAAAPDDVIAAAALTGLRAVADGTCAELTLEYPCHGPAGERWFRLNARRVSPTAPIVVVHEDISTLKRLRDDGARTRGPEEREDQLGTGAGGARTALEHDLIRTTRELRAVTESVGDGLCTLDSAGLLTYVNPPGLRLLRADLRSLLGGSFRHWLHHAEGDRAKREATSTSRIPETRTSQLLRHDGTELPIEYIATPLATMEDPELSGWVIVFRDISERRRSEDDAAAQLEHVIWLRRIRAALADDGFVLHAQPIVDLASGHVVQHELLLRMHDPDHPGALLGPGLFLPIAEALGVAPAIDRWVLAEGLALAACGNPVEINLSATSLMDDTLAHVIEGLLLQTGADPADVVFEITETALLENLGTARAFAARVRALGCRLALDDFGTGYGGFTYLKHFPLDFLKIDIEFVRDAVTNPASRHVIEAVVSLARAFSLQTVAEGVEDEPTLQLLRDLRVDFVQGYLLGRPSPCTIAFPHTDPPDHGAA